MAAAVLDRHSRSMIRAITFLSVVLTIWGWHMPDAENVAEVTTTACPCSTKTPHPGTSVKTRYAQEQFDDEQPSSLVVTTTPLVATMKVHFAPDAASTGTGSAAVSGQETTQVPVTGTGPNVEPLEFAGPLSSLPPGYKLGAEAVSLVNKVGPEKNQFVLKGDVCKLWYPDAKDEGRADAFYLTCPHYATAPFKVTEFAVKPFNSKCEGVPDSPEVRSHAICLSSKGGPYQWHDQWKASGQIPVAGGCSSVTIDCGDHDRITRVTNKYVWISAQTGEYGPEMGRKDLNSYADCCVRHQCLAGPACGSVPEVDAVEADKEKLYDASVPEAYTLSTVLATFSVFVTLVLAVSGVVLASRVDREKCDKSAFRSVARDSRDDLYEEDVEFLSADGAGCTPALQFTPRGDTVDSAELGHCFSAFTEADGPCYDVDAPWDNIEYQPVSLRPSDLPQEPTDSSEYPPYSGSSFEVDEGPRSVRLPYDPPKTPASI